MEEPTIGLHAAILAAGAGTRFGDVKQLVRLRGEPVLHELAANAAFVAGSSVTVVLGAHARTIAPSLRQRAISIALNRGWEEGLASSVRAAVHAAPPGSSALLLMLADQVAVTADDLTRLYASWRRHPILIAAALYQGAPGLPAIFPRWAFTDLLALRGERDPRTVLRRNIDRVVRVPMSNAGIDLNTPDDLLQVEGALAASEPARP
ncbi:MAG TPA: nucleotidyltransferase family protein [Steroidobacteraceae bacterium]|nr:nucleotidyltransferase family protein [Steroidobacteraceae bacterium]